MSTVIRLDRVSKFYRPRSAAARRAWTRRQEQGGRFDPEAGFAALRDVSLAVEAGEAVAVVGRNGAGKTTLMRILAGVSKPSRGRIEVKGKASSLLGLRAGMNPRLSGRENVQLYGGLMGYSLSAVEGLMAEIVSFSGLRQFVDQPVASYSPGMASRLAFATAVTLEPEILLVDEVLAVGDATFQKRALERMRRYFEGGATVVLSSHNSAAIESLCSRVIWLDRGQVKQAGDTEEVIEAYKQFCEARGGRATPRSHEIALSDAGGVPGRRFARGEVVELSWSFERPEGGDGLLEVWLIDTLLARRIELSTAAELPERGRVRCSIATATLEPRKYAVEVRWRRDGSDEGELLDRAPLTVFDPDEEPRQVEVTSPLRIEEWPES